MKTRILHFFSIMLFLSVSFISYGQNQQKDSTISKLHIQGAGYALQEASFHLLRSDIYAISGAVSGSLALVCLNKVNQSEEKNYSLVGVLAVGSLAFGIAALVNHFRGLHEIGAAGGALELCNSLNGISIEYTTIERNYQTPYLTTQYILE